MFLRVFPTFEEYQQPRLNQGYNRLCTYRHDTIISFAIFTTYFSPRIEAYISIHTMHFTLSQTPTPTKRITLNHYLQPLFYDSLGKSFLCTYSLPHGRITVPLFQGHTKTTLTLVSYAELIHLLKYTGYTLR